MVWKDLGNGKEVNVVEYIKNYLDVKPETKLYIGTDSQRKGKRVVYATVVVLYNEGKGGKVLYSKSTAPPIKDNFTRLFKEIETSIETATFLNDSGIEKKFITIDMDYNDDKKYYSNRLLTSALGWATAMGYECRKKPDAFAGSHAADKLVKGLI